MIAGAVSVSAVMVVGDASPELYGVVSTAEGELISVVVDLVAVVVNGGASERGRDAGLDPTSARLMRLLKVPVVGEDDVVTVWGSAEVVGEDVISPDAGKDVAVADAGTSETGLDTGLEPPSA